MSANLVPFAPCRRQVHRVAGVLQNVLVAAVLLVLSFPIDAGGSRGGGAQSREGSGSGSSSSPSSRGSSGGGSSYSAPARGSSSGGRTTSSAPRSSSSGGGRTVSAAPRSPSSGGGKRATAAPTTSAPTRGTSGDRTTASPGGRTTSGSRTVTATGSRGGPGGSPGVSPGGGGGGGRHPRGGHTGGRPRGWYCPPTYYPPSPWYWGGPWSWWWGSYWGSYWGPSWGWGWGGGVYVITESGPDASEYARLDTDIGPEEAEVYLDGTLIGQADDFDGFPDYLYLEPGAYRLEFRHPDYETIVKEIDVRAGQTVPMNDEMKLLPGKKRLQVVHPKSTGTPFGRVFGKPGAQTTEAAEDRTGRFDVQGGPGAGIDGEPLAIDLDAPDEEVPLAAPVAPPAESEAWRSAEPKDDGLAPAEQGRLRFEVEPDDAAVYLDDRYVGTAEELGGLSRGLRVKAGRHTVTVVRPGYGTKTVDVESKAGAAVDVVIELEK